MSFLFANYLWFLPLIAAPLIIHLLKQRNYTNINFSSLKFFNLLKSDAIKRNNVTNLILLIIRTLIILSLILILSRPIYKTSGHNNSNISSSIIIFVDNTVSNYYNIENNFHIFASNLKKHYSPDSDVLIFDLGENRKIYSNNLSSLNKINCEISFNKLDINMSLNILSDYENINSNKTIVFYSDFQNKDINSILFDFINQNINFGNFLFYKTSNDFHNLSLKSIDIDNTIIIPNELVEIKANVINNSNENIINKKISLYINDINVGSSNLSIDSNSSIYIPFKTSFAEFGINKCEVIIDDDDFAIDNNYYFNINIPSYHNISILYNNENELYFLKNALNTINKRYSNMNVKYLTYNEYLSSNIIDDTALFLFGFENLTTSVLKKIKNANLNVTIIPSNYNTTGINNDYFNDETIVNFNYRKILGDSYITLQNNNIKNTYLHGLFNDSLSSVNKNIKIFKSYEIQSSEHTLISYENNTSFINNYKYNNNDIYLITSGFTLNDSNLPIKGSFIPFLYYLINSNNLPYYTFNELDKNFFQNLFSSEFYIKNHNNEIINTSLNRNNSVYFNIPGFYNLYSDDANFTVPLNINKDEFGVITTTDELRKTNNVAAISDNYSDLNKNIENMLHGIEIRIYLIYILIFLILIEMYLSNIYLYDKKK